MKDTKEGFIVTYYNNGGNSEELLYGVIDKLSKENYYLVLASHSPDVPLEIQKKCDFYFYQSLNIVNEKKYSHGVAENNLIELSLLHLKYKKIEYTYKTCYDIIINNVGDFKRWKLPFGLVTCKWGEYNVSTHAFYGSVSFLLKNIEFYVNIESMFSVSNVLETCWEKNLIENGLMGKVYSFNNKEEFFGENIPDVKYFDYSEFLFSYNEEENKFDLYNSGKDFNGSVTIYDFYSETMIFHTDYVEITKNSGHWFKPFGGEMLKFHKNGFFVEINDGTHKIVRNTLVKDFDYKCPFHRKIRFSSINHKSWHDYYTLSDMSLYNEFASDINPRNYVDIGANIGFSSLHYIGKGIKTYMVEPNPNLHAHLSSFNKSIDNVILFDFAISEKDGVSDFYMTENHPTSSIFEFDVSNNNENRVKCNVKSVNPNTFIEEYIEEDYIDLIKIDIEGAEYIFFNEINDENLKKINNIILEFHCNENYKIMDIIVKLAKNDFNYKLATWGDITNPYVVENKWGILYAWR